MQPQSLECPLWTTGPIMSYLDPTRGSVPKPSTAHSTAPTQPDAETAHIHLLLLISSKSLLIRFLQVVFVKSQGLNVTPECLSMLIQLQKHVLKFQMAWHVITLHLISIAQIKSCLSLTNIFFSRPFRNHTAKPWSSVIQKRSNSSFMSSFRM